jgi:hypothetical protein
VEPDLGSRLLERLDQARPQPLVLVRSTTVELVRVVGEQEERRRPRGAPLVLEDPVEAPVRIRAAHLVDSRAREAAELAQPVPDASVGEIALRPGGSALDAAARPLPRHVDVVCQRDREPGVAPPRRIEPEPLPEPLERRVERVEAGRGGPEAIVLVPRAVPLLDAGQVEERLCNVVAFGTLAALHLLPRLLAVRHVVPEAEVAGADRVEHPAGPPLDPVGNHRNTPRATRAA